MPELLILRHAKSDWGQPGLRDFDRPLSDRGRRAAVKMGRVIAGSGPIDMVLASPARRVVETLEGVRKAFPDLPDPEFDPGLYGASVSGLLAALHAVPDNVERALLVAHNPGLHWLAMALTEDDGSRELDIKFPTGALARIQFDGRWRRLDSGQGRLLAFVTPRSA